MNAKQLLQEFNTAYRRNYNRLYNSDSAYMDALQSKAADAFNDLIKSDSLFKQAVIDFVAFRAGDPISSDREAAAFYITYSYFELFY